MFIRATSMVECIRSIIRVTILNTLVLSDIVAANQSFVSSLNQEQSRSHCSFFTYTCTRSCSSIQALKWNKHVAVFSYNFGNYRHEVKRLKPIAKAVPNVDEYAWFFFMDSQPLFLQNHGWTTCVTNARLDNEVRTVVEHHASNLTWALSRSWNLVLTKWFKFGHIPDILKTFEFIVHADSSIFANNHNHYEIPRISTIKSHATSRTQLMLCAHPDRKFVTQEFHETKRTSRENATNLAHWIYHLEQYSTFNISEVPVFAMGLFVRRVSWNATEVNTAFAGTFAAMVKYGLRRDQNVAPFKILQHSISPEQEAPCVFTAVLNESHFTCSDVKWPGK